MTQDATAAKPASPLGGAEGAMLRLIADSLPALISYFEAGSYLCRFANRRYAEYNGWTPEAILGKTVAEAIGEAAWNVIRPHVIQAEQGRTVKYVREQTLPDGQLRMIEVQLLPHFSEAQPPQVLGAFVLINDITEQWRAQRAIRESEERMRKFAQASDEGVVFHSKGIITDVNEALLRMSGYALSELLGCNLFDFIPLSLRATALDYFRQGREDPYEIALLHRDGHEIPIGVVGKTMPVDGETFRLVVVRDITAYKVAQRQIEFLAHHDELTQLPNRAYMRQRMEQMIASAKRRCARLAVLFIDLDGFKTVNDSLGHRAGDLLLREVAARIRGAVRAADLVARLGGDEFLVALADIEQAQDAAAVALKLLADISPAVMLDGQQATVSPSIGISLFPEHGEAADELIRHADMAMYHVKDGGRNNYRFYEPALAQRLLTIASRERQLRKAMIRGQFELHYQPQWRVGDGALAGVSAVLRWRHPSLGLVGPEEFLHFAESRGLLDTIGSWMVSEACRQLAVWRDEQRASVPVAVALSAAGLRQPGLAAAVAGSLEQNGLAPHYLEIEFGEAALGGRCGATLQTLHNLRALGAGLVLNGFKGDCGSLAAVENLPLRKLKIDRLLARNSSGGDEIAPHANALVRAVHRLRVQTVAPNVERPSQLALLRDLGCQLFQGCAHGPAHCRASASAWFAPGFRCELAQSA